MKIIEQANFIKVTYLSGIYSVYAECLDGAILRKWDFENYPLEQTMREAANELYVKVKWNQRYPKTDFIEMFLNEDNLLWIPTKNGQMIEAQRSIKHMCCDSHSKVDQEIAGECKDCGQYVNSDNECVEDTCSYSPTICETCGHRPCDLSC